MSANYIRNIAIVGATGNSGSYMTKYLLEGGKHTVTAITRSDSKSEPPKGCKVATVDYNDESSLVAALKGQDALIITLSVTTPPDTQEKLIRAAGKAGVSWIMPNEWGPDRSSEGVRRDVPLFAKAELTRDLIKEIGQSSYVVLTCGFWYEWSVAIPIAYGFDLEKKEATFFDDGETKISTSTWPQVGRAVAAILSLPIKSDSGPSLEQYRNESVYVNSFSVSQKDMLDSILRVTGDKVENWTITKQPARERLAEAQKASEAGDRNGYVKVMYTRVFYDDGNGDYEALGKLNNKELGLPKEDLDEATKTAIEWSKTFKW